MRHLLAGFDLQIFRNDLFSTDFVLPGVRTLYISVIAQAMGIVLGFLAAIGRQARVAPVSWLARSYIWLFRGTPIAIQIIFWYDAVAELSGNASALYFITRSPITALIVALGVNEGAYMAEIFRSGLLSVDRGQIEAARALGMSPMVSMRRVVMPQALRVIVPPTGNEFVSMLKTSSLGVLIAVEELFGTAQNFYSSDFRYFEPLAVIALWYLFFTTVFGFLQGQLERRLNAGYLLASAPLQPGFMRRLFGGGLAGPGAGGAGAR